MSDKPECAADISAELRDLSRSAKHHELLPTVYGKPFGVYLAELADRVDAVAARKAASASAGYALGRFDEQTYNHGRRVVEDMRAATGIRGGVAQFVTVAVYVDGYLQFAGADICLHNGAATVTRDDAKEQSFRILGRMAGGEVVKGEV